MQYLMASELVFLHWIKISFYGVIEMWTRLLQPVLDKCACGTVYDATKPFLFWHNLYQTQMNYCLRNRDE